MNKQDLALNNSKWLKPNQTKLMGLKNIPWRERYLEELFNR